MGVVVVVDVVAEISGGGPGVTTMFTTGTVGGATLFTAGGLETETDGGPLDETSIDVLVVGVPVSPGTRPEGSAVGSEPTVVVGICDVVVVVVASASRRAVGAPVACHIGTASTAATAALVMNPLASRRAGV